MLAIYQLILLFVETTIQSEVFSFLNYLLRSSSSILFLQQNNEHVSIKISCAVWLNHNRILFFASMQLSMQQHVFINGVKNASTRSGNMKMKLSNDVNDWYIEQQDVIWRKTVLILLRKSVILIWVQQS